jgi:hypothetical protein
MILVANSCLVELVFECDLLGMAVFTLQNDLKQIYYFDGFCIFLAYIIYVSIGIQSYSYLLQSIYRYITVVYSNRLFYQSMKFQVFLLS